MLAMYDLNSIDDIVQFLGGDTAVAEWLDISQPAVGNWKVRGVIPPGWHTAILVKIKSGRKTVDPKLLGMTSDDFKILFGVGASRKEARVA